MNAYKSTLLTGVLTALMFGAGCSGPQLDDLAALEKVDQLYFSGRFEPAQNAINQYLQKYPKSSLGHKLAGWIALKLNDLPKAKARFSTAITLNPRNDNAYVGLGAAARKEGDLRKAREYYGQSLAIEPDNPESIGSLLVVELLCGDYPAAIRLAEQSVQHEFEDPALYGNAAIAYHYAGNFEQRDRFVELARQKGYYNLQKIQQIFSGEIEVPVQDCTAPDAAKSVVKTTAPE